MDKKTNIPSHVRISVSNLFKEMKSHNDAVQIPCVPVQKWTVLLIEIPAVLQKISESLGEHTLKSFTLSANQTVRGVFTSDILYSLNDQKKCPSSAGKTSNGKINTHGSKSPNSLKSSWRLLLPLLKKFDEVKFRSEAYKTSISNKTRNGEVQDTEQSKF